MSGPLEKPAKLPALPSLEAKAADARRHLADRVRDFARGGGFFWQASNAFDRGYEVVLSRHQASDLARLGPGLWAPYVRGPDGKFTALANLAKLGPNFWNLAGVIVGHAFLVQIEGQLNRISQQLDLVTILVKNLPAGALEGVLVGLEGIDDLNEDEARRRLAGFSDILTANVGTVIKNLKTELDAVPDFAGWWIYGSNAEDVRKTLGSAQSTAAHVVLGLRLVAAVETRLHGDAAAARSLLSWEGRIPRGEINRAEGIARMLQPLHKDDRPELVWRDLGQSLDTLRDRATSRLEQSVISLQL